MAWKDIINALPIDFIDRRLSPVQSNECTIKGGNITIPDTGYVDLERSIISKKDLLMPELLKVNGVTFTQVDSIDAIAGSGSFYIDRAASRLHFHNLDKGAPITQFDYYEWGTHIRKTHWLMVYSAVRDIKTVMERLGDTLEQYPKAVVPIIVTTKAALSAFNPAEFKGSQYFVMGTSERGYSNGVNWITDTSSSQDANYAQVVDTTPDPYQVSVALTQNLIFVFDMAMETVTVELYDKDGNPVTLNAGVASDYNRTWTFGHPANFADIASPYKAIVKATSLDKLARPMQQDFTLYFATQADPPPTKDVFTIPTFGSTTALLVFDEVGADFPPTNPVYRDIYVDHSNDGTWQVHASNVALTWDAGRGKYTYEITNLQIGTVYGVKTRVRDDGTQYAESGTVVVTTSGVEAPTFSMTTPATSTGVAKDTNIVLVASKNIDPATFTYVGNGTGSAEVYDATNLVWVAGVWTTSDNITWTFNPTNDLSLGASIEVKLSTAIKSVDGGVYGGADFGYTVATHTSPTAPVISPAVTVGNGTATVTLQTASSPFDGATISGYDYYSSPDPYTSWTKHNTNLVATAQGGTYQFTGLTNGVAHKFKAVGQDSMGARSIDSGQVGPATPVLSGPQTVTQNFNTGVYDSTNWRVLKREKVSRNAVLSVDSGLSVVSNALQIKANDTDLNAPTTSLFDNHTEVAYQYMQQLDLTKGDITVSFSSAMSLNKVANTMVNFGFAFVGTYDTQDRLNYKPFVRANNQMLGSTDTATYPYGVLSGDRCLADGTYTTAGVFGLATNNITTQKTDNAVHTWEMKLINATKRLRLSKDGVVVFESNDNFIPFTSGWIEIDALSNAGTAGATPTAAIAENPVVVPIDDLTVSYTV